VGNALFHREVLECEVISDLGPGSLTTGLGPFIALSRGTNSGAGLTFVTRQAKHSVLAGLSVGKRTIVLLRHCLSPPGPWRFYLFGLKPELCPHKTQRWMGRMVEG
jgi:hypothetical protein